MTSDLPTRILDPNSSLPGAARTQPVASMSRTSFSVGLQNLKHIRMRIRIIRRCVSTYSFSIRNAHAMQVVWETVGTQGSVVTTRATFAPQGASASENELVAATASLQAALVEALPHLSEERLVDLLEFVAIQHSGGNFKPDNSAYATQIADFVADHPYATSSDGVTRCARQYCPLERCTRRTHSPAHTPLAAWRVWRATRFKRAPDSRGARSTGFG